jgi:hypothetical protein
LEEDPVAIPILVGDDGSRSQVVERDDAGFGPGLGCIEKGEE